MIDELKQAATDAGADEVIYDRRNMQNVHADSKQSGKVICFIDELDQINMTVKNNGLAENYLLAVAFTKQVEFGDTADNNADVMSEMRTCVRKFMLKLVDTGLFYGNLSTTARKFGEQVMDANLIGWQMTLNVNMLYGYTEC